MKGIMGIPTTEGLGNDHFFYKYCDTCILVGVLWVTPDSITMIGLVHRYFSFSGFGLLCLTSNN